MGSAKGRLPGASGVRGVLFDLDGTLADTHDLILGTFHYAVKAVLGRDFPDEALMCKVGQPLDVQMWDFTDDRETHDELCRTYREHNKLVHDKLIRRFPGTRAALERFAAAGAPMGVVTSKRREPALAALVSCGIGDLLTIVVGSDDCAAHKPDPGPVLRGCELIGVDPSACAYVGDSPFDLQAGAGAGCFTVAALWGMFSEGVLRAERPDAACASIGEVADLLLDR